MLGQFSPGFLATLPSDPDARFLALARRRLLGWKPPKRGRGRPRQYGDSLLTQKPPRRTGRAPGRRRSFHGVPLCMPLVLVAETWLDQERRNPDHRISLHYIARVVTRRGWYFREVGSIAPEHMAFFQTIFRPWRDREPTLCKRLYELARTPGVLADARLVLEQNRPEVAPILDRVFGQAEFPAGFSDK